MNEFYKIGKSNNIYGRINEIAGSLPYDICLICTLFSEKGTVLESVLHEKFSDKRINGEWFLLDDEDVEYIKGLANEQTVN